MKSELKEQILSPIIHLEFLGKHQVYIDLDGNGYLQNEPTTKKVKRIKSNSVLKRYCKNLSSILFLSLFSNVGKLLEFFEISS
jgi:hypothetical protein